MRLHTILIFAIVIKISTLELTAQQSPDDVVLKAMKDEVTRNMAELKLPDLEKPFFIMYGISDQKNYSISASLGSITRSIENRNRFRSTTRVLVGDYEFNDESLDDNQSGSSNSYDLELPLEDDYLGIRRSFWVATDRVYRDAARNLEKNKESLKETGKALKDIPHRSFAKTDAINLVSTGEPFKVDKTMLEERARKLSSLFLSHPTIWNSGVVINFIEGHQYLVNSEGSLVKVPFRVAGFTAIAFCKNKEGEQYVNGITHLALTPDKLPNEQLLTQEIEKMIAQLENQSSIPKFSEEYSGPVLITGQAVAEVFASGLFNTTSIMASDNIPKLTGYQYDNEMYISDSKIGKNVLSESVSVIAKPKLRTFNGVDLLGSFSVDNEGVVPKDEVTVVERGVLKCLLNNRTITNSNQTANGFSTGPGVVQVTIAEKNSEKSLKKKLLERAKKQGLDYALIVRSNEAGGIRLLNVYKVSVKDGTEELTRGASVGKVDMKTFKHILGATEKYEAYNIGNLNNNSGRGLNGLTSFIVPTGVLFDELDVNRFHIPSLKETDYVQSPLTGIQK